MSPAWKVAEAPAAPALRAIRPISRRPDGLGAAQYPPRPPRRSGVDLWKMAEIARRPRYRLAEYLILEDMSNVRHEYLDGHIFAMAGGTPEHGGICAKLIALLSNALTGRACRVFTSDVRVRVRATGLDTYPDASVMCGRPERDVEDGNALTNPLVLVEVTSPSTEAYDRGDRL